MKKQAKSTNLKLQLSKETIVALKANHLAKILGGDGGGPNGGGNNGGTRVSVEGRC